jgi:hypothetical protein
MELMGRLAGLEVMESFASWLGAPVEPGGGLR